MKNHLLKIKTQNGVSLYNLNSKLKELVANSSIKNGSVLIFTKHTTAAIRIIENEERLLKDINLFLEKIAPTNANYLHDDVHLRDVPPNERINGHSHIKALYLNSSESIPVIDGKMALGKWQSIFFIELDGSRQRELLIQIRGN